MRYHNCCKSPELKSRVNLGSTWAGAEHVENRSFPKRKKPTASADAVTPITSAIVVAAVASHPVPPPSSQPASHAHATNIYPPPRPPRNRLAPGNAEARPLVIERTSPRVVRVVHRALRELFPIGGGPLRGPARAEQLLRARPRARARRRRVCAPCVASGERLRHRRQDFGGHQGEGGE